MMKSLPIVLTLAISALGCGGGSTEQNDANSPKSEGSSSSSPSSSSASSSTDDPPKKSSSATSSSTSEAPKGPIRFEAYNGPKGTRALETPQVWTILPPGLGPNFEYVSPVLVDRVKSDGSDVIVQYGLKQFALPQLLAVPATAPAKLAAGDVVFVNTGLSGAVGHVTAVGAEITVKYVNGSEFASASVPPAQVLKLGSTVAYGQPVTWKAESGWQYGIFIGGDASQSFIATGNRWTLVSTTSLKAIDLTKKHKKGAKVWAYNDGGNHAAGTVAEVRSDNDQYMITLPGTPSPQPYPFSQVSAPIE
ncbi:MAG: hypothetical protein U0271_43840 [Polyangiaceae bacterium]